MFGDKVTGSNKKVNVSFNSAGDFLNWWFEKPRLNGQAENILKRYYSNYSRNGCDYLNMAWTDRHLELEKELDVIRDKPDVMVLDIGCGTGSISLYIAHILRGKGNVLGIDINKERLYCAIERKKVLENEMGFRLNCTFMESSIVSHSGDDKYDLIYLEEAFHHMEPRREIVKRISGLLKHRGVVILSEVNAYNPFMQLSLLKRRGLKTIEKRHDENDREYLYGVERILPAKSVARLFKTYNLKVNSLRYFRLASSALAKVFDKRGVNLMAFEGRLLRFPLLSRLICIHYNIVLQKEVAS